MPSTPGLDGRLVGPDVARVADVVEALGVVVGAGGDVRHQPSGRLAVLAAGLHHGVDRGEEILVLELAGDAQRRGQVEMADPEAVDAVERGDRVGVLDAGPGLDLGEEGGARVGGGELLQDGTAPVEIVRHAQRHAALAVGHVLHAVQDGPRLLGVVDHRQHDALGPHVGGAGDVVVLLGRHAHDRRQPGGLEVAQRRS